MVVSLVLFCFVVDYFFLFFLFFLRFVEHFQNIQCSTLFVLQITRYFVVCFVVVCCDFVVVTAHYNRITYCTWRTYCMFRLHSFSIWHYITHVVVVVVVVCSILWHYTHHVFCFVWFCFCFIYYIFRFITCTISYNQNTCNIPSNTFNVKNI